MDKAPDPVLELPEAVIRLGESDGFRRACIHVLYDDLAAANGEIAVLRHQLKRFDQITLGEMEEALAGKDSVITEQSDRIVALREEVERLTKELKDWTGPAIGG